MTSLKNIFHTLSEKKIFLKKEYSLPCVRLRSLSRLNNFFTEEL